MVVPVGTAAWLLLLCMRPQNEDVSVIGGGIDVVLGKIDDNSKTTCQI